MRAAVLGSPIGHSLSPVLHRAAYAQLGLAEWSYEAIECTSNGLPALLERARAAEDFGGYSLTMPLKVVALPLLDVLEPLATEVAAVNTVVKRGGGLFGANTDVPGLVNALAEAGIVTARSPVVLGGGGSAQAALAALARMGAPVATVVVRNRERAAGLAAVAERCGVALVVKDFSSALAPDADLVISTVPAGGSQDLVKWIDGWPSGAALFDLVYAPWPTPLAAAVAGRGARVLGGLELLVHQAVGQVELMTGYDVNVAVLRRAGEAAIGLSAD